MNELSIWKTTIWTGKNYDQPVTVSADSLAKMPIVVAKWLRENPPQDFSNVSPASDLSKRVSYFYSDGTLQPLFPSWLRERGTLKEGWYRISGEFGPPTELENYDEAIEHFIQNSLAIEKGSDYKEIPLTESDFPIHLIKTTYREKNIQKVNDMLQRGWYIIALEFEGKTDYTDKLLSRETVFVLGHPEANAF